MALPVGCEHLVQASAPELAPAFDVTLPGFAEAFTGLPLIVAKEHE